ncbi:MAG: Fic family protein [Akkermansia sp.]|nr:Fic family protein [Akkermansia sp.]
MKTDEAIMNKLALCEDMGRTELAGMLPEPVSDATVKRALQRLVRAGKLQVSGRARATRYRLSAASLLLEKVDLDEYYSRDADEREVRTEYNLHLIGEILPKVDLYTAGERKHLRSLQAQYARRAADMPPDARQKELKRFGIDLSWKSSQIEGNTYTLLETERLLDEQKTAEGRTRDEATMLLNHKDALDEIVQHLDSFRELGLEQITRIHTQLVKYLGVDNLIRTYGVGIVGTNYRPPESDTQIRRELEAACRLVNGTACVFSKALLALALVSYIQPYSDGNKRTARLAANAVMLAHGHCPLSYRTVDPVDYKKAMLLFYERNNLSAIKQIFMEQFEDAVKTYS